VAVIHQIDELDRISGKKKTRQLNPRPLRLPVGASGGKVGGTYPRSGYATVQQGRR